MARFRAQFRSADVATSLSAQGCNASCSYARASNAPMSRAPQRHDRTRPTGASAPSFDVRPLCLCLRGNDVRQFLNNGSKVLRKLVDITTIRNESPTMRRLVSQLLDLVE